MRIFSDPSNAIERMLAKYRQITGNTKMMSEYLATDEGMKEMEKDIRDKTGKLYEAARATNKGKDIIGYLKS